MYVVEHNWHAVAGRFCQTYVSRNNRFEDLGAEEAAEVGGYLFRKCCSIVIHREEYSLNGERWVDGAAETH